MRCLYYCTTPLQVLNALNLHINKTFYNTQDRVIAEIAIVNKFKDAKSVYENLKDEAVFDYIYLIKEEDRQFQRNGLFKAMGIAWDVFFPLRLLKQQYGPELSSHIINKYDYVISSFFSHSIAALLSVNPQAKYIMMDDGIGSYYGDWTKLIRSDGYLKLLKFKNKGIDISVPLYLYVMRADLCDSTIKTEVRQMDTIDDEVLNVACDIFSLPRSLCSINEKMIWLTQPYQNSIIEEAVHRIANILNQYNHDVVLRIHPRDKESHFTKDFKINKENYMWELLVKFLSIEKKLLISYDSTAVFTPKILYDKEPWILFAYKLCNFDQSIIEETTRFVNRFSKLYTDSTRICVAETWEQFEDFIFTFNKTS